MKRRRQSGGNLTGEEAQAVRRELKRRLPARGHRKRVAYETGVTVGYLSSVIRMERAPNYRLARGLGFRLVPPGKEEQ